MLSAPSSAGRSWILFPPRARWTRAVQKLTAGGTAGRPLRDRSSQVSPGGMWPTRKPARTYTSQQQRRGRLAVSCITAGLPCCHATPVKPLTLQCHEARMSNLIPEVQTQVPAEPNHTCRRLSSSRIAPQKIRSKFANMWKRRAHVCCLVYCVCAL